MPAIRRSSAAQSRQSILSFGNSKVTKPSRAHSAKDLKKHVAVRESPPTKKDTIVLDIEPEAKPEEEKEVVSVKNADEDEVAARKISKKRLDQFYTEIRNTSICPPFHQKSLGVNEKILRHFDLSGQYGPCIGMSRTDRWKRASNLGMNPPLEVLAACLAEENANGEDKEDPQRDTRRAFIDDYLSTRRTAGL